MVPCHRFQDLDQPVGRSPTGTNVISKDIAAIIDPPYWSYMTSKTTFTISASPEAIKASPRRRTTCLPLSVRDRRQPADGRRHVYFR